MRNRPSIKFVRTDKGFIGSCKTADTFLISKGADKNQITREIKEALKGF